MSTQPRRSLLAPFQVRSFRFQWPADLLASWAQEMETLRLAREWANVDALVKRHTEEVELLEAAWSPLPLPPTLEETCSSRYFPHLPLPNSLQLHLNFTTQNHLNISPFSTLCGSLFGASWASKSPPISTQVTS